MKYIIAATAFAAVNAMDLKLFRNYAQVDCQMSLV